MGKHEAGSPKDIAKKIKAKGLQRLRWYCQFCQKQCRDENGFKCHIATDAHNRQMEIVSSRSNMFIDSFSQEFESEFMKIISRRYPTTRVNANHVYNQYIKDRHHVHMNATRWSSLTEFCTYLGRESKCVVEETEKGWFITYINHEKMANEKEEADKRLKEDGTEEDRQKIEIERRLNAMIDLHGDAKQSTPSQISSEELTSKSITLNLSNHSNNNLPILNTPLIQPIIIKPNIFNQLNTNNNNQNNQNNLPIKKKSALEEIMEKQLQEKKKQQEMEFKQQQQSTSTSNSNNSGGWLIKGIIVKIVDKELGEYYKQKGVVIETSDDGYMGKVRLIDNDSISLKIDQEYLETVIPAQGNRVVIVRGRHRGMECRLVDIDTSNFSATLQPLSLQSLIPNIPYEDFTKLY